MKCGASLVDAASVLPQPGPPAPDRDLRQVRQLIDRGDPTEAARLLSKLIVKVDGDPAGLQEVRDLQLALGDLGGCIETCRKIVTLEPANRAWFELIHCALEKDRIQEAISAMRDVSQCLPDAGRSVLMAALASNDASLPAAVRGLQEFDWKACDLSKPERRVLELLQAFNMDASQILGNQMPRSSFECYLTALALQHLGDRHRLEGRPSKALAFYQLSRSIRPLPDISLREEQAIGQLLEQLAANRALTRAHQTEVVEHPRKMLLASREVVQTVLASLSAEVPDSSKGRAIAAACAALGEDSMARGQWREARQAFEQAQTYLIPEADGVGLILDAIGARLRRRRWSLVALVAVAAGLLVAAFLYVPGRIRDHRSAQQMVEGEERLKSKKFDEALGAFEEALRLTPDHAERKDRIVALLMEHARLALERQDAVPSLQLAEKAHDLDPEVIGFADVMGKASILRGQAQLKEGAWSHAEESFRRALGLIPRDGDALFGLANALGSAGRHQAALESVEALIQLQPTRIDAYLLRGRILRNVGNLRAAIEDLSRYWAAKPGDMEAFALLEETRKMERASACKQSLSGAVRKKQFKEAGNICTEACSRGDLDGCRAAARIWFEGKGGQKKLALAREMFLKTCEVAQDMEGCRTAGMMARRGQGGAPNRGLARRLLEKACSGSDQAACNMFGIMLASGEGGTADLLAAKEVFVKACLSNNWDACFNAALLALGGNTGPVDLGRIRDYLTKACEANHGPACNNLAFLYEVGDSDNPARQEDFKIALELLRKACDGKNAIACVNASRYFAMGTVVSTDYAEAQRLLDRACRLGNTAACTIPPYSLAGAQQGGANGTSTLIRDYQESRL